MDLQRIVKSNLLYRLRRKNPAAAAKLEAELAVGAQKSSHTVGAQRKVTVQRRA